MFREEDGSRIRFLAVAGLMALSLGLGYSLGLNHKLDSPGSMIGLAPSDPDSIILLKRAGKDARAAGDAKTADWLDEASEQGKARLVAWAAVQAHGGKHAASR